MKKDYRDKRRKISCGSEIQFLTDELQRGFIIQFCVAVVLGSAIAAAVIYGMSSATVTTTFEGARLKIVSTADFILPAVLLSSAVVVVFIGLSVLLIILLSYRRMKISLCQIKEEIEKADTGDLEDIHLNFRRRDDEFKLLALTLNKMIQDFKKTLLELKSDAARLEADCQELARKQDAASSSKVREDARRIKERLAKFHVHQ